MICLVLLAAFGFAWVVGFSHVSLPIRRVLGGDGTNVPLPVIGGPLCTLLECPGCLGFHLGWLYELVLGPSGLPGPRWFQIIAVGCAFASSNFILGRLTKIIT